MLLNILPTQLENGGITKLDAPLFNPHQWMVEYSITEQSPGIPDNSVMELAYAEERIIVSVVIRGGVRIITEANNSSKCFDTWE